MPLERASHVQEGEGFQLFDEVVAIFGFVVLISWAVGMFMPNASPALTWLDGLAGVCALIASLVNLNGSTLKVRISSLGILSLSLFLLWLGGLIHGGRTWQAWMNFVFAVFVLSMMILAPRFLSVTQDSKKEKSDDTA